MSWQYLQVFIWYELEPVTWEEEEFEGTWRKGVPSWFRKFSISPGVPNVFGSYSSKVELELELELEIWLEIGVEGRRGEKCFFLEYWVKLLGL